MKRGTMPQEDLMIHELTTAGYDRVWPLYEPLTFMLFCAGVLQGCHDGRIFVDDP